MSLKVVLHHLTICLLSILLLKLLFQTYQRWRLGGDPVQETPLLPPPKLSPAKDLHSLSQDSTKDTKQQGNSLLKEGAMSSYNDRVLTITDMGTPDPYVVFDKGIYYMTFTAGDRVEVWSSDSLFDFESRAQKTVVWRPPPNTPYSADIWAPELHSLQGRWYVYVACADPAQGNKSHRMYVLAGPPDNVSPVDPSHTWEFAGRLEGLPDDQWAIDGTVATIHGSLLFVYSGWPLGEHNSEKIQSIFLIEMISPTSCTGAPIQISQPDQPWEFSGDAGINEGPQVLASPWGNWIGVAYSCAGSWTHEYKLATIQYVGAHPSNLLDSRYWVKSRQPLLTARSDDAPPYGPGHGCFVQVGAQHGTEIWGVFHATDAKTGWEGRRARVMRVGWGDQGPWMGRGECGECHGVDGFLGHPTTASTPGPGPGPGPSAGADGGGDLKNELRGLMGEVKGFAKRFLK